MYITQELENYCFFSACLFVGLLGGNLRCPYGCCFVDCITWNKYIGIDFVPAQWARLQF